MRRLSAILALPLVLLAAGAKEASASTDTFGAGDAHNGSLSVTAPNTIINAYARMTTSAAAGATTLDLSSATGFAKGDLVLLVTMTGYPKPASGTGGPFDVSSASVGRWELARISDLVGNKVTMSGKLLNAFEAATAQVVKVPEYLTVNIASSGSITAKKWDGQTGGIVAFLASSEVSNAGKIDVSALGYRGGEWVNNSGAGGCTNLDEPQPNGAGKGEGITGLWATSVSGRGNLANGAGGGVCRDAGGGGGGNGGKGGVGGRSGNGDGSRNVGGIPGAALKYSVLDHLTFGGGGGGGTGNASTATPGGYGGGIIFLRVAKISGAGSILANGQTPGLSGFDGCGGGGAGGTVLIRAVGTVSCSAAEAKGGTGGSSGNNARGPGGGGGGGRILIQSGGGTCTTNVAFGFAGKQATLTDPYGPEHGAEPVSGESDPTGIYRGLVEKAPTGGYCGADASCASGKVCDIAVGVCVECNTTANCAGGKVCNTATKTCGPCTGDASCTTKGLGKCDTSATLPVCVACVADGDCGSSTSAKICDAKACKDGCRGAGGNGCAAGDVCSSSTAAAGTCSTPPADTGPADTGSGDTGSGDTGSDDTGSGDTAADSTVDSGATETATDVLAETATDGSGSEVTPDTGLVDAPLDTSADTAVDDTATDTAVDDTGIDTAVDDSSPADTGTSGDTSTGEDAATDTAVPPAEGGGDSGGCSVPNVPSSSGNIALVTLGVAALLASRRRR